MKKKYEAYSSSAGDTFAPIDLIEDQRKRGLLGADAKLLYTIEADTLEEALAVHNLRRGFGPYTPPGEPKPCPKCHSWFYPEGSGQCWKCGKVC